MPCDAHFTRHVQYHASKLVLCSREHASFLATTSCTIARPLPVSSTCASSSFSTAIGIQRHAAACAQCARPIACVDAPLLLPLPTRFEISPGRCLNEVHKSFLRHKSPLHCERSLMHYPRLPHSLLPQTDGRCLPVTKADETCRKDRRFVWGCDYLRTIS